MEIIRRLTPVWLPAIGVLVLLLQSNHGASLPDKTIESKSGLPQGEFNALGDPLEAVNPPQWTHADTSFSTGNGPDGMADPEADDTTPLKSERKHRDKRESHPHQPGEATPVCNQPPSNIRNLRVNNLRTIYTVESITAVLRTDPYFRETEDDKAMDFNVQQRVAICLNVSLNNMAARCFVADAIVNTALRCRDDLLEDEISALSYVSRNGDFGLHALCVRRRQEHDTAQCNCHCFNDMLASRRSIVHAVRGSLRSFVDGVHSQQQETSNGQRG